MIKIKSHLFYVKNKDTYPPFKSGLYLEEFFLDYMIKNNRIYNDSGRRYIPSLWTNFQIEDWFSEKEKKEEMQVRLNDFINENPCEAGYFTVAQHDNGPMLQLPPNTIVYGACSGNVPIPLIYEDVTNHLVSVKKTSYGEKTILCSFIGSITHVVRNHILQFYSNNPNFFISTKNTWTPAVTEMNQSLFIDTTLKSKFVLSPRGYGRSSFRFFEVLQLGSIPIYVWDDIEWLPYKDVIDYSLFSISIHVNDLPKLEGILLGIDEDKYNEMLSAYKRISYVFQLDYLCKYILSHKPFDMKGQPLPTVIKDAKISLCIPTMNRFDHFLHIYLDKYIEYLYFGLIDEIVICDENGDDFNKINIKYSAFMQNNPGKLKVFKNNDILGVFLNKIKVCSLAQNKYIALIDSDNFADEKYFATAKQYIINNTLPEHFILAPSFAKPLFHFGPFIRNGNVKPYFKEFLKSELLFKICFNTGNYILSNTLVSNIRFDYNLLKNITSCDVIYFNLLCFQQLPAFEMHIIKDMEYEHVVHDGSTQTNNCHIGDHYLNNLIIPAYHELANPKKPINVNVNINDMPIHEKLKMPFYSIGNKIIDYFFKMGLAFAKGENFVYELPCYLDNKDNIFLLKNLPNNLDINDDVRYCFKYIHLDRVFGENYGFVRDWDYANLWELTNNDRLQFWTFIRPIANRLLNLILPSYQIENKLENFPIIHFRCSDVPFIRHGFYHFQRYQYFIDSLNELSKKGVDVSKVYLMHSLTHESSPENMAAATIYILSLAKFLESHNYIVELVSQNVESDFIAMFYAPAVISTCSSFSFVAGFFGNGLFITEGHYNEDEDGLISQSVCYAPFIKKGYSVNHKRIVDYYDTESVIKILQS
uniref:Uncharacterized protein n=1 Tax=viral metagenome TaxID=1070528 RepID=A0A6C0DRI6_9ZZZZ